MKKNTIVQFVCFQTDLDLDTFMLSWEKYAGSLGKDHEVALHQHYSGKKKFKYLSRHTSMQDDFRFLFVKGKKPEHFVDYNVKVVQAGGYIPLQMENRKSAAADETKVLVFFTEEIDQPLFKKIEGYTDLNIYQAYFESSSFSYILEFFVANKELETFMQQLKQHCADDQIGIYKECVLQEN